VSAFLERRTPSGRATDAVSGVGLKRYVQFVDSMSSDERLLQGTERALRVRLAIGDE